MLKHRTDRRPQDHNNRNSNPALDTGSYPSKGRQTKALR